MSKRFLVEYQHKGATYGGVEVVANDWDEAAEMVRSMRFSAKVIGSDVIEIPLDKWLWACGGFAIGLTLVLIAWASRA